MIAIHVLSALKKLMSRYSWVFARNLVSGLLQLAMQV
jgi:hypothetical protein